MLAVALAACALAPVGCYRRVVGARGLGTGGATIQKPSEPSLLDQILGPEPQPLREGRRMRVN